MAPSAHSLQRPSRSGIRALLGFVLACTATFTLAAARVAAPETSATKSTEDVFADELLAAPSPAARQALLAAHRERVTAELFAALFQRGLYFVSRGMSDGLAVLDAALAVAEARQDDGARATVHTHLALTHVFMGDLEQAQVEQDRAEALIAGGDDKRAQAYVWNRGAELYFQRGDYARNRTYLERSLALFQDLHDDREINRTLHNLARGAIREGKYTEAIERYRAAYEAAKLMGDPLAQASRLLGLGSALWVVGDNAGALDCFERGLRLAESVDSKINVMRCLGSIAQVHLQQGGLEQALRYQERALAVAQALGTKPETAEMTDGLARILVAGRRLDEARQRYQEGLRLSREIGAHLLALDAEAGLAGLDLEVGELDASEAGFASVLALAEAAGDRHFIGLALQGQAEIRRRRGQHEQAIATAGRAADLARAIGARDSLWRAGLIQARALRAMHKPQEALRALDDAIATIESLRADTVESTRHEFLGTEGKLALFHEAMDLSIELGDPDQALAYAERAKARTLLEAMRVDGGAVQRLLTPEEAQQERDLVERWRGLNRQILDAMQSASADHAQLAALQAEREPARLALEAYEAALDAAHPERRGAHGRLPQWTAAALPTLDKDTALLEFVVTDAATYLFALTRDPAGGSTRITVRKLVVSRGELRAHVQRFGGRVAARRADFAEDARTLYDLLLRPVAADLAGKRVLAVVPDDVLWELPFQALQSATDRYLVDDHALFSAPSLSVLQALRTVERTRAAARGQGFSPRLLALGDPAVGQLAAGRVREAHRDVWLDPIPEAGDEVRKLQRLYGRSHSDVYTGALATEATLKASIAGYDVVHIAAHAILDDVRPLYSTVVLSQGSDEDGLLEAWEIRGLRLKAGLVVLSACQTGSGRVTPGEGVIGMAWALFAAGAQAAVVSQWKVDSVSTTPLMVAFHTELRKHGVSSAEALRRASNATRRSARHRHPYYWAGFVVLGAGAS